jgi:hypothetical protein
MTCCLPPCMRCWIAVASGSEPLAWQVATILATAIKRQQLLGKMTPNPLHNNVIPVDFLRRSKRSLSLKKGVRS